MRLSKKLEQFICVFVNTPDYKGSYRGFEAEVKILLDSGLVLNRSSITQIWLSRRDSVTDYLLNVLKLYDTIETPRESELGSYMLRYVPQCLRHTINDMRTWAPISGKVQKAKPVIFKQEYCHPFEEI